MIEFFDIYGNIKPNSWDDSSENPTTFNVAWYFSVLFNDSITYHFMGRVKRLITNKYCSNNYEWRTNDYDGNPDWSLDEKISALAFFARNDDKFWLKKIPIFPKWNNSSKWSWFRPDVLAYTIGSKYKWTRFLMWPIILIDIKISVKEFRDNPQGESSGVQLAFITLMGWNKDKLVNSISEDVAKAMGIYYPEENHPTRKKWNESNSI